MNQDLIIQLEEINDDELIPGEMLPNKKSVVSALQASQALLMPGYYTFENKSSEELLDYLVENLQIQISKALILKNDERSAIEITRNYLNELPTVKKKILTDIQAIYNGDPACIGKEEVILSYPGFLAIFVYRLANVLYQLNVPVIPRLMTEYGHEKTGIDINPGATIGEYFCIDHGTGVVIGETAVIGHHVKLYQGVTIGARSFKLDENGHPVKGGKRHPNLGNNVVVYANATILGGDTYIADNSVIPGNSWITSTPK